MPEADEDLIVDACLSGGGGTFGHKWFSAIFPGYIMEKNLSISELELLNVLAAVRLFENDMENKIIHIRSDSASSVSILQTGRGRCKNMLACARQIWAVAARSNIIFRVSHIMGRDNIIADALSRRHLNQGYEDKVQKLRVEQGAIIVEANEETFALQDWKPYSKQHVPEVH